MSNRQAVFVKFLNEQQVYNNHSLIFKFFIYSHTKFFYTFVVLYYYDLLLISNI